MTARSTIASLTCATLLAGCSPADTTERANVQRTAGGFDLDAATQSAESCLLTIWADQADPDVEFDRRHDQTEGGAISCATGTTPSQFRAAIEVLREAANANDKARLLEQVGMPLLFIDSSGERRELTDPEAIDAAFDEVFDARTLDLLKRLDLSQIAVDRESGAYFELGSLWLVVDEHGGRPRLVTVNRQALEEAAEAARREAENLGGAPVPLAD